MSDIEEIIASAKPKEQTVPVCVRGDLNARIEDLERQLADAQGWKPATLAEASPVRALAEQIEACRAEMKEHEHVFRFRAIEPRAWSDLLAAHPGDKDKGEVFNDAFPAAAVAACAVDPVMNVDQVERLSNVLNQGQWDELFTAAWRCNTRSLEIPFSVLASATLSNTEQS